MWTEGQQRDIPLNFVSLKKQKYDGIFCLVLVNTVGFISNTTNRMLD